MSNANYGDVLIIGSVTSSTDLSTWHLDYPLDSPYPTAITYDLTILTTDGLFVPQDNLKVIITNVKQPPVFLNLPSSITIDENLPGNSVVYQVIVENFVLWHLRWCQISTWEQNVGYNKPVIVSVDLFLSYKGPLNFSTLWGRRLERAAGQILKRR